MEFGGGLPEGVVLVAAIRLVLGWRTPDHGAAHPLLMGSFQFFDSGINIFERNQADAVQAFGTMRTELRHPVVIGTEAGPLQVGIRQSEERHPERGVEHFRFYAVDLLVFDAFDRVPAARTGGFVAFAHMVFQLFARPSGPEPTGDRKGVDAIRHKDKARLLRVFDHFRRLVTEFIVQTMLPQIGRLHHMRVCRDHASLCHTTLLFTGSLAS